MKGKDLENFGAEVLKGLGLHVDHDLENAYKKDLDKNGKYEDDDQLEVDYLIPVGGLTLVGEITGEKSKSDSKEHVRTLSNSINVLRKGRKDEEFWSDLGVPDDNIHHYLGTKRFLGFFISNKHGKFEVELPNVSGVVNFYKHDWETIKHYSKIIGQYGKRHFLEKLGVEQRMGTEKRIVIGKSNHLASYRYRHITGSVDSFTHVYRFEISPYDILSFSRVARRDDLPSMPESSKENYQRPLDETDVREIRDILRDKSNFIFPNNILCALSNECEYDEDENHLIIPQKYGSITVIDGQHRLYSYADNELKEELTDPLVSITAIGFDNATREEVNAYSAYTFLEINSSQSPVDPEFLDVISYDVLRKNDKDSIAAKIIKDVNEL